MKSKLLVIACISLIITAYIFWFPHTTLKENSNSSLTSQELLEQKIFEDSPLFLSRPSKISNKVIYNNRLEDNDFEPSQQMTESLTDQFVMISNQFKRNDYRQLASYHNIVTYCSAIPKTEQEFTEWSIKHGNDEDVDFTYMQQQVDSCKSIPIQRFQTLEILYRKALANGEPSATLVLAKLLPFDSREKFKLLSKSAVWSLEAINLLAEKSLAPTEYLTNEQRMMFLSLSPIAPYHEEYETTIVEVSATLNDLQAEEVDRILDEWKISDSDKRVELIKELSMLNKQDAN